MTRLTEKMYAYPAVKTDDWKRLTGPVLQVAFLDFVPFEGEQEFFATYKMRNVKTGRVYTDKFALCLVDLKRIHLATKEDEKNGIAAWARLFAAKTWEELRMIAKGNETLDRAVSTMYQLSRDEIVRQYCEADEGWNAYVKDMEAIKAEHEAMKTENEAMKMEIGEMRNKILELERLIERIEKGGK